MIMPVLWVVLCAVLLALWIFLTLINFATMIANKLRSQGVDVNDGPSVLGDPNAVHIIKTRMTWCFITAAAEALTVGGIATLLCDTKWVIVPFGAVAAYMLYIAVSLWGSGKRKRRNKIAARVMDLGHKLAISPV